ncbi:MAG: hypothetical protein JKY67_08835 [Pseudomonadales bacterium]|nr:hypothetical protein [Pseudomonadales bacterium]
MSEPNPNPAIEPQSLNAVHHLDDAPNSTRLSQPAPLDAATRTRLVFGVILILLGIIAGLGVVYNVIMIIDGTANYPIIQQLIPEAGARVITTPRGDIELPERLFRILGYGLVIFLLGMVSKIAAIFLRFGCGLLNSDLKELVINLKNQLNR